MNLFRYTVSRFAAASLAGSLVSLASPLLQAQNVKTHHVWEVVATGQVQALSHASQDAVLNLNIVLPLRDPDGLQTFLEES